jgi:hypothetical protein
MWYNSHFDLSTRTLSNLTTLRIYQYVGTDKRREKVVVLRELQRAIIYTNKMSKQVTKSHVRDAVHMYLVNWGAMLTRYISLLSQQ